MFNKRPPAFTISQLRAARALLGWSQSELAERAGLSRRSVAAVELGATLPYDATLEKILSALERAGIEFSWRNDGAVGVWLSRVKV